MGNRRYWRVGLPHPGSRGAAALITHQTRVQVVDVDTGAVAGEVKGFIDAHAVVLDPNGQVGYVSDGRANLICIFDRRTFEVKAKIHLPSAPRALVFEPQTGTLFAFGALPTPAPPPRNAPRPADRREGDPCSMYGNSWPPPPAYQSLVSIIDPDKQTRIADVRVCGVFGAAQADGGGQVYFAIANFNQVGRLNASTILQLARDRGPAEMRRVSGSISGNGTLLLDLKMDTTTGAGPHFRVFPLGRECQDARAVAVDAARQRLFAACANQKLKVLTTDTGASIAGLTIGPGVDAIAYDAGRGLIFTANGGGYGSVTVVRQHLTDSYAVIQNLPTLRAGTDHGRRSFHRTGLPRHHSLRSQSQKPAHERHRHPQTEPVDGSFQVLVIGN